MEPSIHEPALMQTVQEQVDNHNDFLNYVNEFYKDLTNYYEMLEQIESTTKEIYKRIQEHFKYKYSARGVCYMYEAKNDAENMLQGIHFLQDTLDKMAYMFVRVLNPQNKNVFHPLTKKFDIYMYREFPDLD